MKTNITLKLESELVREARVLAARRGSSVSRLMAEILERLVRRELGYEAAEKRALARLERGYELDWIPAEDRGELYER